MTRSTNSSKPLARSRNTGTAGAFALLICCLLAGQTARGQHVFKGDEEKASATAQVQPSVGFETVAVPGGRYDPRFGVFRSYQETGPALPVGSGSTREIDRAVRAHLNASRSRLGSLDADSDLTLEQITFSPGGTHVLYRQTVGGIPVFERTLKVNLDKTGRPTLVFNGLATALLGDERPLAGGLRASLQEREARRQALAALSDPEGLTQTPELVLVADPEPRLAWSVVVYPSTRGEFLVLIDAHSGDPILVREETLHRTANRIDGVTKSVTSPGQKALGKGPASETSALVDATGYVYDPDPLATSGQDYAPPYVDGDDADTPELRAERKRVVLPDITQGGDGLYRLVGPHVEVVGRRPNGQVNYEPPEESAPVFDYTRDNEHFEAAMVYYHVDKAQRYVQALGFTSTQNAALPVNPFGEGEADISNYYINQNFLSFGAGGVDDGEDAFVIWHEYGHALLNASAPGITGTFDGRALHEGWSDYWASSYQRHLFEADSLPDGDWRRFFRWDGNNAAIGWFGRVLTDQGVYPQDMDRSNIYAAGLLWADAMMDVYGRLGRDVTDMLNLQSHLYLGAPTTFPEAAFAVVQADIDLFDAEHAALLVSILARRGLVDSTAFVPAIDHQAAGDTEELGSTATFVADISSLLYAVSRAEVVLAVGDGPLEVFPMREGDDNSFSVDIQLPSEPSLVTYFVEAQDAGGQVTRLPSGAPVQRFQFQVGPDTEPPTVAHNPISTISLAAWPPAVVARVTDNIGVDTVWVEFELVDDVTGLLGSGSFGLEPTGDTFVGAFPAFNGLLDGNEETKYRIRALDLSTAKNETAVPVSGQPSLTFRIVESGVLATYDFESDVEGVSAGGLWERGTPAFGTLTAHSGTSVWFTSLTGPYAAGVDRATLTLPEVDLSSFESAFLEFWHWYDTEHDGFSDPGSGSSALLWDGGNVTISLDGGSTWTVAVPVDGYDGRLSDAAGNPKGGEPAFGGYSFGWRRALVALPAGSSVQVRFDFGSDVSNEETAVDYAGWAIDDVSIRTDRVPDAETPIVLVTPPAISMQPVVDGKAIAPTVRLTASDNTGVESVRVDFETTTSSLTTQGSVRLAMTKEDLLKFEGVIPVDTNRVGVGDRIEYRVRVGDYDGNVAVFPPTNQDPLVIQFQKVLASNTLTGARASDGWAPLLSGWRLENPSTTSESIVLSPVDVAENAGMATLALNHDFRFGGGEGGNLKVSADGGSSWSVIQPEEGYGGTVGGEAVFVGTAVDRTSVFDLVGFLGQQVRLRVDYAGIETAGTGFWEIRTAVFQQSTAAENLEITRKLAVHPNFPNPFQTTTTISYTVAVDGAVRLEVYDVTGRRVKVLTDAIREAGTYTETMYGSGLSRGVYVVRLRSAGKEAIRKIVYSG